MRHDEYYKLKELIQSNRRKMIRLSSDSHVVVLPLELLQPMMEALENGHIHHVAEIIGFGRETLQKWQEEYNGLVELKNKVDSLRKGRKSLSNTILIRPAICSLARHAPAKRISEFFKIPNSTLDRWLDEARNGTTESVSDLQAESLSTTAHLEKKPDMNTLENCGSSKELEHLLSRHKAGERRIYSLAEKKLILKLAERFGSKSVRDRFKVSYDTIARLKRRSKKDLDRKRKTPLRYAPVIDLMKKHPGMGPMQIRDYMRRHIGLSMSVNSIRNVMEENGWVSPYTKRPRITEGIELYQACRRNYLWHVDFKHQHVNTCKAYIFFIQDDNSRFIVNHRIAEGERSDDVIRAIDEGIRLHGKPEVIMSDGGSAFYSWRGISQFTRYLEDHGIEQIISQTPNVNGKLENLNGQIEKELIMTSSFPSLNQFAREVAEWVGFYNFRRVHQSLGDTRVPADRYFPGACKWYSASDDQTKAQSLIAETMSRLLTELKK